MGIFDNAKEQDADDDVPWADPVIRHDFETALGAFILAFNEVDYWLALILRREMIRRNVEPLYDPNAMFARRLETLKSIAPQSDAEVAGLPYGRIKKISEDRNALAHGHFDQNPYDGNFNLVRRHQAEEFSTAKVMELTEELRSIAGMMRSVWYVGEFCEIDAELPPRSS